MNIIKNFPFINYFKNVLIKRNPSHYVKDQKTRIQDIPKEIILEIFSYLDVIHLPHIRLVNKQWKKLSEQVNFKIIFSNDSIFHGTFKNNKWEGRIDYLNEIHIGEFKLVHKKEFKFGALFKCTNIGEFKYGLLNDQGKKIFSDGAICQGRFLNGLLYGQCKITFANGKMWEGKVFESAFYPLNDQGKKTSSWAIYEGKFSYGLLDGQGKHISSYGQILEGEFKYGCLHGRGKATFPNGEVHEGKFKGDRLNGHAKITFSDGEIWEGEFKNDYLYGQGKRIFSDGEVWLGEFKDNKLNGKGKIILADGKIIEGEFKDGELIHQKQQNDVANN